MNNVFTIAALQIYDVAAKGAVCFALVSTIRLILSVWNKLDK